MFCSNYFYVADAERVFFICLIAEALGSIPGLCIWDLWWTEGTVTGFLQVLQFSIVSIIQIIFCSHYFYVADAERVFFIYLVAEALGSIPGLYICDLWWAKDTVAGFLRVLQFSVVNIIQIMFCSHYLYVADAERVFFIYLIAETLDLIPGLYIWDLWWAKDTVTGFSPNTSVFPRHYHSPDVL